MIFPNYNFAEHELVAVKRRNCEDVAAEGFTQNGLYDIAIRGKTVSVYCDFQTDGGNWLVSAIVTAIIFYRIMHALRF